MAARRERRKWSDVKKSLQPLTQSDLVALVGDLYSLRPANRDFLHARFLRDDDAFEKYKDIIFDCLWPDLVGGRFQYRRARKAIADYKKATADEAGEIALMLHYVETGTAFTCDFGDIDETFYDSLLSVARKAAEKIGELPSVERERYRDRFRGLVKSSDGIGWGYHDELDHIFSLTFPES